MRVIFNIFLAATLLISAAFFVSCVDGERNLFDADKTKELYQSSFPVQNIDPEMDWKTTRNINVTIGVNEDLGTDYKVQIFDLNPLDKFNHANLLGEGYANQNMKFETTIDCPTALTTVFVARIDGKGRYKIKPVSIENSNITTNFGDIYTETKATRVSDHAVPTMECPYDNDEIIKMLNDNATEEVKSGIDLVQKNKGIFKITKDFSGSLSISSNKNNKLIVAAKWIINNVPAINGAEIIVADGGEISISNDPNSYNNASLTLINKSYITVMPGGKITGTRLQYTNGSNGQANYNGGTINVDKLEVEGGPGQLYNYGDITVKDYNASTNNVTLINWGKIVADNMNGNNNTDIKNGCYIKVNECLQCRELVIGENASVECGHLPNNGNNNEIYMEKNSMLTSYNETSLLRKVTGPLEGNALFRIGKITGEQYQSFPQIKNNIICEIADQSSNKGLVWGWSENTPYTWSMFDWLVYGLLKNGATYCNIGKADFILPAGDCTGEGYNSSEDGDNIETNPMNITYAFEDNYPSVGDYDFNDIVLNVSTEYDREVTTNKIKSIQYNITLNAIGASKKLGAGLRLAGIEKSAIESIRFGGRTEMRKTLVNSMFENSDMERTDNEVVIPLFGDAHLVYGSDERIMLNTGEHKLDELYTLEVIIELTDKSHTVPIITQDNLDFFIAYSFGNKDKRTEIHLYEFRDKATANGNIHHENLDVAGQLTWAISIPGFKYPIEGIKITDAYPQFEKWAQNHTSNLDWYQHPTEKNDKKYIYE